MADTIRFHGFPSARYAAFISYSHAVDGKLAPKLQKALNRFAKPFYARSRIRIFRDKTSLSVTPALWPAIEEALGDSQYFILLASPAAAQSPWVQKEVTYWLQQRGSQTLFITLTEGEIAWDDQTGDFDWSRTTALPAVLRQQYTNVPFYLDLRNLRKTADLSHRNPEFRDVVARLAAKLHNRPLDEMYGEDVRSHRTFVRVVWAAIALLSVLTVIAVTQSIRETRSRKLAEQRRVVSLTQALAAHADRESRDDGDLERAALLARQAYLFNLKTDGSRVAQVDAALRSVVNRSNFGVWLPREGKAPGALALSRDGRWLALAEAGAVRVWDRLAPGTAPRDLPHDVGDIRSLLFEPGGGALIAVGSRGLVQWDTVDSKGKLLRDFSRVFKTATLGFTSKGQVFAAILWPGDTELIAIRSGRVERSTHCCEGVEDSVAVAIGPSDLPLVAIGDAEGTVRLWRFDGTTSPDRVLTGHKAPVLSLVFDERGEHLAVGTDLRLPDIFALARNGQQDMQPRGGQVTVWDLTSSPPKGRTFPALRTSVTAVALTAESHLLAAGGGDGVVRLWRSLDPAGSSESLPGGSGPLRGLAFAADGETLAATGFGIEGAVPGAIRLWRLVDIPGAMRMLAGHDGAVRSFCFPSSGNLLVSAGGSIARVWNLETSKRVADLSLEEADAVAVACAPSGNALVIGTKPHIGSLASEVQVWDWSRPNTPVTKLSGHGSSVDALSISPDGRWLASAGALEPEIHIRSWSNLSGEAKRVPTGRGDVRALAFSPDSRLLAWGDSEGRVGLASADRSFSIVNTFVEHQGPIRAVVFSPDGKLLASAGETGEIAVRHPLTGTTPTRLLGHRGEVYGLAFAARENVLLSAGDDGTVRLWSLGRPSSDPRILTKYGEHFRAVAMGPDGKRIVAGGASGSVFEWLATDALADAMCQAVWRNLNCAEWSRFVGEGIDYMPTCKKLPPADCRESR